ncbi:MAG: hypothetical protein ABIW34_11925 [Ginsengibacter sp.]
MSNYIIDIATEDDNAELCSLCQIPSCGNIIFTMERSPDFFAASKVQSEQTEIYVCRNKSDNKIEGVLSVGKRRVFYKNEIKQIRYFSDMRILPQSQGSRLLYNVVRFITDNILQPSEIAQAIVFAENTIMLQLIQKLQYRSKKMSIFNFYPAGNYTSYMVKFSAGVKKANSKYHIKKATPGDVTQIQAFIINEGPKKNFFPYYDLKEIGRDYYQGLAIEDFYLAFENKKLIGIAGVWDQQALRQTKIIGYSLLYKILRPAINLIGFLSNGFTLPPKNTLLKYVTVHSILIDGNNSHVFENILTEINNDNYRSGFDYFLVGLDAKDNLNKSLSIFKNKRKIKGNHFLISKTQPEQEILDASFYLEAARI